jgi:hypothetical protein
MRTDEIVGALATNKLGRRSLPHRVLLRRVGFRGRVEHAGVGVLPVFGPRPMVGRRAPPQRDHLGDHLVLA